MKKLLIILFLFVGISVNAGTLIKFDNPVRLQNYPYTITCFRNVVKLKDRNQGFIACATFGGEVTLHKNDPVFLKNGLYVGRKVIIVSDNVPFNSMEITPNNIIIVGYYCEYGINGIRKTLVVVITNHHFDENNNLID